MFTNIALEMRRVSYRRRDEKKIPLPRIPPPLPPPILGIHKIPNGEPSVAPSMSPSLPLMVYEIRDEVDIPFTELGEFINGAVSIAIQNQRVGMCTQKYGYIHSLIGIKQIIETIHPPNAPFAKARVVYYVYGLCPYKDLIIDACVVGSAGSVVTLRNHKLVCITKNAPEGTYVTGDVVKCRIMYLRYKPTEIQCVVEIVSPNRGSQSRDARGSVAPPSPKVPGSVPKIPGSVPKIPGSVPPGSVPKIPGPSMGIPKKQGNPKNPKNPKK